MYDYIIIGAGISGIAAAEELSKKKESYIVLEKEKEVGGHVLTREIDGCTIDLGFIYGRETIYLNIQRLMKKYNLHQIPHPITYGCMNADNQIVYENTNQTSDYQSEIQRFYDISSHMKWRWWWITFQAFCDEYKFSKEFQDNVFGSALSVLFLSTQSFQRPAYVMVEMLRDWVALSLEPLPYLFTIQEGNISIIQNLIREYNIQVHTNTEVLQMIKHNHAWRVYTRNKIYTCKKIICTCSPRVIQAILPRQNVIQKYILNDAVKNAYICYGILHRDSSVIPQPCEHLYYYKRDGENWFLTGVVSKQRDCDCDPIYLTVSNKKKYIESQITKEHRIEEFKWYHQGQSNMSLLYYYILGISRWCEWDGLYFAGGWTSIGVQHEESYKSGRECARRSRQPPIFFICFLFFVIILTCILIFGK